MSEAFASVPTLIHWRNTVMNIYLLCNTVMYIYICTEHIQMYIRLDEITSGSLATPNCDMNSKHL